MSDSRFIEMLLILGNQIPQVALRLNEIHLIQSLTTVPPRKCLSSKQIGELVPCDTTYGCLDVVWYPLCEVGRATGLQEKHLFVNPHLGG